eukprot:297630-Rhodomonas_salina.1
MQCAVLNYVTSGTEVAYGASARYGKCGTEVAYGARAWYGKCGTEIAHGGGQCVPVSYTHLRAHETEADL